MADVKTYREGAAGEPKFSDKFEVAKKAVLQMTDISNNNNKYYAIELHTAPQPGKCPDPCYRVYTHYGRTDDLESNPNAGARESRYFYDLGSAEACYRKIYGEKTKKGYKELSLASAKIGSRKSVGQSVGEIDAKTLKKLADKQTPAEKKKSPVITISAPIQELVSYLYSEATNALVNTVQASITANGIETPLGVLTIGQIDKGQAVLDAIAATFSGKQKQNRNQLTQLSGDFYTVIPHKFGRSREQAEAAVIDTAQKVNDKQDTLQLMRDMLNVNGKSNVLVNPEIESKYQALNCSIEVVPPTIFKEIKDYVEKSAVQKWERYKVKNVWKVARKGEAASFAEHIGNNRRLFHGSAAKNWLGILSRGLLLPKIVVSLGVHRTDAGWLGNGIYFGDAVCTSCAYAHPGKRRTRFLTVATVALGKIKQYRKITYGLNSAPDGFHSAHGVRGSEFSDNEFVVYKQNQQKLEYLVEIEC